MPVRKQFQSSLTIKPGLRRVLEEARNKEVSEEDLKAQRVSFAFGNAPTSSKITKDSMLLASKRIRLTR